MRGKKKSSKINKIKKPVTILSFGVLKLFSHIILQGEKSTAHLLLLNSKLQYRLTNDDCYITELVCLVSSAQTSKNTGEEEEGRKNWFTRSKTLTP